MPEFDIKKIQTLLSSGLAKASAELNRVGFDKLSHDIQRHSKIKNSIISQRYIDERIYQQIKKNRIENKPKVNLKQEYLDELAIYLDYDGFSHFEDQFSIIYDQLKFVPYLEASTKISIIFDHVQADQINERSARLLYQGQLNSIKYQPVDFNELDSKKFTDFTEEGSITILLLSPDLLDTRPELFDIVKNEIEGNTAVIPLWSNLDLQENKALKATFSSLKWLTIDDIHLLVQYILSGIDNPTNKEHNKSSKEKSSVTNIRDSGTVNLGKIGKIKAEYISSRDMHININKSKLEDK